MNLFSSASEKPDLDKINQIKTWTYAHLQLTRETPISVSQLRCSEPGCPPLETVIAVMTNPVQKFKIHKSVAAIEAIDITQNLSPAD
ncbi:hypothetical protein Pse7367_2725 [Thalassoporum mexicanum PCC 7367]|uniref:hypothetical protein n=1 Tax=Thalassoporum mexicanum TaxID=3457544 RepID=UPI00029FCE79|nr:hypothetical protein [Pseudanabaena sp. PCC 7367]AFY70980.1 hypothetical protein Pse7367_2725 [Pseudanabaena sp. PCC 7367]